MTARRGYKKGMTPQTVSRWRSPVCKRKQRAVTALYKDHLKMVSFLAIIGPPLR